MASEIEASFIRSELEMKDKNTVTLRSVHVLGVPKRVLIDILCNTFSNEDDERAFREICRALEDFIRAANRASNEELIERYSPMDPTQNDSADDTESAAEDNLSIENQKMFLGMLFEALRSCRFQVLENDEWQIATSSTYLFHLPAEVNKDRLDATLFENFKENYGFDLPDYCEKRYLIFRRGIGIDRKNGYFWRPKGAEVLNRLWKITFVRLWKWMGDEPLDCSGHPQRKEEGSNSRGYETVRRINMSNSFTFKAFFKRMHLEEPTFERTFLLYSMSDTNRIHLKHYTGIPMADMELILVSLQSCKQLICARVLQPEKKHPRLPPLDWILLLVSALVAALLILKSYNSHHPHRLGVGLVFGIIAAFFSYCAKIYYTFNQNLLEYERLISRLMHDKQLDCGHGALLHVCEEAIQLEVKEAILAYFVLGSNGATDMDLCQGCNDLLKSHFSKEKCTFEESFVARLLEKNVVIKEDSKLKCLTLEELKSRF